MIELPRPLHYALRWPATVGTSDLVPGTRGWRIGKQQRWLPAATPGEFVGLQGTFWLGFDGLDAPRGSSGGPVITEQGIAGMIVEDGGNSGMPSNVLPVETIAAMFHQWRLPWNLSRAGISAPSADALVPEQGKRPASVFGLDVPCSRIEPSDDVQAILREFGSQALTAAPAARIASIGRPVIVRPSIGGDDHLGALPANTRVRVICMGDRNFAVIKEERGNRDGVVESRALEQP